MRISLKFLAFAWIGLLLIIGGLFYNAYSKLKPETFIALITEQVQKNYPGAKLNVGKISYRFSLDFNLNLQDIHLRRSGKLLSSIGEVELKVPWWLLLFNRGNAQINLSKMDIFIDNVDPKVSEEKVAKSSANLIKVSLPSYLADAKFTLRAKEVSIRDIHTARRYFVVSKLLVREFQYGKNSAFELNIPISIKHKEVQYSSELWLFGDVTPDPSQWDLNYRGEFRTKESNEKFQLDDLVINGKARFIPTTLGITSDINLSIEKSEIGNGQFVASQESLAINLSFTKLPLNYIGFIYEEIKNPYLTSLDGDSYGSIKFIKNFETSTAAINAKLEFDGNLQLSQNDFIPGKWQIGFQNSRWDVSFMSPKGEASFFRRSVMDLKRNIVTQYNEELGFSGVDLTSVIKPVKPVSNFITEIPTSYFVTSISYNKCIIGDKAFDGTFRYGLSPDQKFYQGELKDASSSFKVAYLNKGDQHSLDLNLIKFPLSPTFNLLTPFYSGTAKVDGKFEARWGNSWEAGQWLMNMNFEDANETSGKLVDLINKTTSFFELENNDFKKQEMKLSSKSNILTLNSLMLTDFQTAKITGLLSSKQKSFLTLTYPKNKKFKAIKKEVLEPYWMQKEEK